MAASGKRIEFTISDDCGERLSEPGFVQECVDLPMAIMHGVEDYLEVQQGQLSLPIRIDVRPSSKEPTC